MNKTTLLKYCLFCKLTILLKNIRQIVFSVENTDTELLKLKKQDIS